MSRVYRIVERPAVLDDYLAIADHIELWTGDIDAARRTVEAIREHIHGLRHAPHRGMRRDDLRPGLRIVPCHKRAAAAIEIDEANRTVTVVRVFYGSQDYETVLRGP